MSIYFIDEVSMISNVLFNYIHLRLDDIFPSNQNNTFGGQNMLLFGDFLQVLTLIQFEL